MVNISKPDVKYALYLKKKEQITIIPLLNI